MASECGRSLTLPDSRSRRQPAGRGLSAARRVLVGRAVILRCRVPAPRSPFAPRRIARPRPPRLRDHARVRRRPGRGRDERAAQLVEPAALARPRTQREVDRLPELARQLAALAAQRRQVHAEPPAGRAPAPVRTGLTPASALVQDEREREQIGGRAGRAVPGPARAPCTRPSRSRRRCRVSESPPSTRATPKSVSLARPRRRRRAGRGRARSTA